jgi:hypothetical protein
MTANQIEVTSLQRCALIGILVEYALDNHSTQTWEDVSSGETTTLDELLTLLHADEPPMRVLHGHSSERS